LAREQGIPLEDNCYMLLLYRSITEGLALQYLRQKHTRTCKKAHSHTLVHAAWKACNRWTKSWTASRTTWKGYPVMSLRRSRLRCRAGANAPSAKQFCISIARVFYENKQLGLLLWTVFLEHGIFFSILLAIKIILATLLLYTFFMPTRLLSSSMLYFCNGHTSHLQLVTWGTMRIWKQPSTMLQ
jgi:hypothetical protein